jgi:hypothetical protein
MIFGICLTIVIVSILITYILIIRDIGNGVYKVKNNNSILAKEAEEKYSKKFPEHTLDDLNLEIEHVADLFINIEPSNRYTEALRQKAKNDEKIKVLKDAVFEEVELIKYVDDVLKARVKYRDYENRYSLILSMNTVTLGRIFLNNYYIYKEKNKEYENDS